MATKNTDKTIYFTSSQNNVSTAEHLGKLTSNTEYTTDVNHKHALKMKFKAIWCLQGKSTNIKYSHLHKDNATVSYKTAGSQYVKRCSFTTVCRKVGALSLLTPDSLLRKNFQFRQNSPPHLRMFFLFVLFFCQNLKVANVLSSYKHFSFSLVGCLWLM